MSHFPGFGFFERHREKGAFFVRLAALLMVINFVAALVIAHLDAPLDSARLALCMLFSSLFLLFNGAGALSLDYYLSRKRGGR